MTFHFVVTWNRGENWRSATGIPFDELELVSLLVNPTLRKITSGVHGWLEDWMYSHALGYDGAAGTPRWWDKFRSKH